MKILILGGHGMAGHMIRDYLTSKTVHDVWCTVRSNNTADEKSVMLDARNKDEIYNILEQVQPDVAINAIGILNHSAARNLKDAIYVNGLLPHWLDEYGQYLGFRLIHISTDCVFSGTKGNYREVDYKDGTTIYAQTKSLGEVVNDTHLTIRTSIIGPEIKEDGIGLLQWFLQQSGVVYGYRKVFWNGITTLELAKTIDSLLQASVSGLVHLTAPEQISKLELLQLFQKVFEREDITIRPNDKIASDKTLVNTRKDFNMPVPGYEEMLRDLKTWMQKKQTAYVRDSTN